MQGLHQQSPFCKRYFKMKLYLQQWCSSNTKNIIALSITYFIVCNIDELELFTSFKTISLVLSFHEKSLIYECDANFILANWCKNLSRNIFFYMIKILIIGCIKIFPKTKVASCGFLSFHATSNKIMPALSIYLVQLFLKTNPIKVFFGTTAVKETLDSVMTALK